MRDLQHAGLIVSLIKNDLVSSKLILSLNQIGLRADDYYLDLHETVFKLMGLEELLHDDKLYDRYLSLVQQVMYIDFFDAHVREQSLTTLAQKIYQELQQHTL